MGLEVGRGTEGFPWGLQREYSPADTWMLDFWSEPSENKYLLFPGVQFMVNCYASPRNLNIKSIIEWQVAFILSR